MKFEVSANGLLVPIKEPEAPKLDPIEKGFKVKEGWTFHKTGDRFYNSGDQECIREALELLYTTVDPGGGGIRSSKDDTNRRHLTKCLHELSEALVGGIPTVGEVYT